jgi:hypothetical protein
MGGSPTQSLEEHQKYPVQIPATPGTWDYMFASLVVEVVLSTAGLLQAHASRA